MANVNVIPGYYGSGRTPAFIFTYQLNNGATWYCVYGGTIVNKTMDEISDGTNVETLSDYDCFTNSKPITDIDQFIEAIK